MCGSDREPGEVDTVLVYHGKMWILSQNYRELLKELYNITDVKYIF